MRYLPAQLLRLLVEQEGVVTYRQCLDAGLSHDAVRHRLASGSWQRLARGIYCTHAGEVPFRSRVRAALLATSELAVLSHLTSGHIHRLDGLPPAARIDVTVPPNEPRRSTGLVSAHRAVLSATDWSFVGGLRVTNAARTCLDLARTQPPPVAVRAVESALSQGRVRLVEMAEVVAKSRSWPGVRRMQLAMAQADPRSESLLETAGRLLLVDAGLLPEEVQLPIRDEFGHLLARADLAWPVARVVVEFDGVAPHAGRAAFRHDRRRQNALVNRGWLVLRFTWEDVFARPAYVVQEVRTALRARQGVNMSAAVGAA